MLRVLQILMICDIVTFMLDKQKHVRDTPERGNFVIVIVIDASSTFGGLRADRAVWQNNSC